MRDRKAAAAAAATWFLGLGCGFAVVKAGANDAGEVSGENWIPERGQADDPDSGMSPTASLSGQLTLLGATSNAGAQVTVVEPGTSPAQTVTDSNGSYLLDALPSGDFTAIFGAPGYQSQSRQGALAAGDAAQISITLERSLLLSPFQALPDGGIFLGYAQWVSLPDGGSEPGDQLFYLDPSGLAWLAPEGDAGAAAQESIASDGGLRFVGFDAEGGAIVQQIDASGATTVDFVDEGTLASIPLGAGVSSVVSMGDRVFFGKPSEDLQEDWSCWGRGDLGPTPLERAIGVRSPPIALTGRMAGWSVGDAGNDTPVIFAPELSLPLDQVCSSGMTPLQPSLDGDRFAFAVFPPPVVTTFGTGASSTGACTEVDAVQVFIFGSEVVEVEDDALQTAAPAVYPISNTAYAGEIANPDGSQHLFVRETASGNWKNDWEGDVEGWAPLHGTSLLAADRVDGGVALVVVAEGQEGAAARNIATTGGIPFAHEWSTTLFVTPDNRYVVLAGIASLFDLEKQTETPLVVTPVAVEFDRSETTALLTDASGQMATLSLDGDSSDEPRGTPLEGVALAASFTPAEDAVVYLGTDPMGTTGLFVQPIP